jgi:UrcA family protein
MRARPRILRSTALAGGILAATLALAPRAVAQDSAVAELTVIGHGKPTTDTYSYVVGYSDLDLRQNSGRKELRNRVSLAATYVCRKLAEREVTADPNCRVKTIDETMAKVRSAEHQMRVNAANMKPGRPWIVPGA